MGEHYRKEGEREAAFFPSERYNGKSFPIVQVFALSLISLSEATGCSVEESFKRPGSEFLSDE